MADNRHDIPDIKVHGANIGPCWGRLDPGEPHVGPMNFAIWDRIQGLAFYLLAANGGKDIYNVTSVLPMID